jgi:hypothetical protein
VRGGTGDCGDGGAGGVGRTGGHPSLSVLELGYNPLGPKGAATIAGVCYMHGVHPASLRVDA